MGRAELWDGLRCNSLYQTGSWISMSALWCSCCGWPPEEDNVLQWGKNMAARVRVLACMTNMSRPSSQYCNKLYEKKQYKILKDLVFPFKYCFFCPIPIFFVQIRFFPSRSSSLRPDIVFSVQGLDLSIWIRIFPSGSDFFCLNPTGSGTATNTSAAIPDLSWRSRIPPHH